MPLTWAISLKYQWTLNFPPILKFRLIVPIIAGTYITPLYERHMWSRKFAPVFYLSLSGSCCSYFEINCIYVFSSVLWCLSEFENPATNPYSNLYKFLSSNRLGYYPAMNFANMLTLIEINDSFLNFNLLT